MNGEFEFQFPWLLALLGLLPVYVLLLGKIGKLSALKFSSADIAREAGAKARSAAGRFLFFLRLLAVALGIVALAGPRLANYHVETETPGDGGRLATGARDLLRYLVSFGLGLFNALFAVAYGSFLPSVVSRADLAEGNAKLALAEAVARVAGPGRRASRFTLRAALVCKILSRVSRPTALLSNERR